jgi:hypothetical protein
LIYQDGNMKLLKLTILLSSVAVILVIIQSCSQIQRITQQLENLKRLQFKLDNVSGFRLAGIDISNKRSINDVSLMDGLKLTQAFATKSFPADFTLNVAAKNPNDGKGGSQQTMATLKSLDWTMYIDDVKTIDGNINHSIDIPGTGQTSNIPLGVSLDLYKFIGSQGYDKVINLAMNLGGVGGSPSRLKLDAQPTVETPMGPITYPGRITIVDKEFR